MPTPPLNTTSYAVLSLLSLRSWTGYELVQQGRRGFYNVWPKEDSVIYEEPRRLVARGLATAHVEKSNGRSRNRYEITEAGRAELRGWLASPPVDPKLEIEPLVRLVGAHEGEVADVLAVVTTMRAWAQRKLESLVPMGHELATTGGLFPERVKLNVLGGELVCALYETVVAWAETAEKELATWERTTGAEMTDGARARAAEWLAAHPSPPDRPAPRRE